MLVLRRSLSAFVSALLVASTLVVAASPAAAYEVTTTTRDPGKELRADWFAGVPIQRNRPTACFNQSRDSEYVWYCRSIAGSEEHGNRRNWVVDFSPRERPLAVAGSNASRFGISIVTPDGGMYSGCIWESPTNNYTCDYREWKPQVLPRGQNAFALRKLWNWALYVGGSPLACAEGVRDVWRGRTIRATFVVACLGEPM